jgi:hypothetical protein
MTFAPGPVWIVLTGTLADRGHQRVPGTSLKARVLVNVVTGLTNGRGVAWCTLGTGVCR